MCKELWNVFMHTTESQVAAAASTAQHSLLTAVSRMQWVCCRVVHIWLTFSSANFFLFSAFLSLPFPLVGNDLVILGKSSLPDFLLGQPWMPCAWLLIGRQESCFLWVIADSLTNDYLQRNILGYLTSVFVFTRTLMDAFPLCMLLH